MIVRHIEQTYQYTISYLKAWRAKQRVFEIRFSTYKVSYDNLPRMLSQVAARNPRSFYDTYLVPAATRGQRIMPLRKAKGVFVSPYFSKEAAVSSWGHKIYGIGIVGPFIQDNENKMFIHDPATKKEQRLPSDTSYSEWYGRVRSK